ncbi:transmembrane protein 179B [Strigops habroptila]|uniref:transmembrane protein 179B n=1 Tax=Strigops habroptila TaxID=2489341 RepID=UPI0011CFAAA4|nr:transmembrane protein 179B [Strigops habroptila]
MAVSTLQLVELVLHGAAFLCGIACASALTVAQGEFGGWCILYGTVSWNGTVLVPKPSSHLSLCYFISGVSIVVALYCFSSLLYGIFGCCTGESQWDRSWLRVTLVVTIIILFFLLISACILRVGMDVFCASIMETKRVSSCRDAQHESWASYSPVHFYSNLSSAQSSAWVTVFLWCLLTARLLVQRRQEPRILLLRHNDPECSAEAEATFGGNLIRP